jgi:hypothetical protein
MPFNGLPSSWPNFAAMVPMMAKRSLSTACCCKRVLSEMSRMNAPY